MKTAQSRGVALIEALVALAVMAFGLLGVVGMQASLRFNADVSRQRAEGVRLAQEKMEQMRSFGVVSGSPGGEHDYTKIVSGTDTPTVATGFANTTFTRTVTVRSPVANDPKMKLIEVEVEWLDRRTASGGTAEKVRLTSSIAEVAPILGASLGLPGDRAAPQRPTGRNVAIPPGAVDQGNGTSIFTPPGAATGVSWTFSNASGQITNVCTAVSSCTAIAGTILSGYIRFIAYQQRPSDAESETPTVANQGGYPPIDVTVNLTLPTSPALPPSCFTEIFPPSSRAYYCFVPVDVLTSTRVWSGQSVLGGSTFAPYVSTLLSDNNRNNFKVCRYTPTDTHTPTGGNTEHPLNYTAVSGPLINQNFLVHSAGNNSTAYLCPDDDTSTPLVNGNTFFHQPTS